jgi:hypothetical protein
MRIEDEYGRLYRPHVSHLSQDSFVTHVPAPLLAYGYATELALELQRRP